MWCPKCRYEYRAGATHCPDCKTELVEEDQMPVTRWPYPAPSQILVWTLVFMIVPWVGWLLWAGCVVTFTRLGQESLAYLWGVPAALTALSGFVYGYRHRSRISEGQMGLGVCLAMVLQFILIAALGTLGQAEGYQMLAGVFGAFLGCIWVALFILLGDKLRRRRR